ncbi:hypothetical protein [Aliikangiella maris]
MKQFHTSKINLVSSPKWTNEKCNNDETLIADIYYDSGVDKIVFQKLYLETLKRYFSKVKGRLSEKKMLLSIREALRKRRYRYLPDGVAAEDVHGLKDVWTYATFVSGLLLPLEDVSIEKLLQQILDKTVIKWLIDKNVWDELIKFNDENIVSNNVLALKEFYGVTPEKKIKEVVSSIQTNVIKDGPGHNQLTNREIGKNCLDWLFRHAENEGQFAYKQGDKLIVNTPIAFVEYGKKSGFAWKSAQKGLIKLGLHKQNEEDGSPFCKVGDTNVMVIGCNTE